MIGWLRICVRNQSIIVLYFEFENELKFYNLGARCLCSVGEVVSPLCSTYTSHTFSLMSSTKETPKLTNELYIEEKQS